MADMCDAFREYLVSVKKASANTVDSYMRDIHQYSAYCASKNTEPAAADASFIKKSRFYQIRTCAMGQNF